MKIKAGLCIYPKSLSHSNYTHKSRFKTLLQISIMSHIIQLTTRQLVGKTKLLLGRKYKKHNKKQLDIRRSKSARSLKPETPAHTILHSYSYIILYK